MTEFSPKVFIWARETAGLELTEAAKKLSIKPERLAAIEAGEISPTRTQLAKMSEAYRRPLVVFYLTKPPEAAPEVEDFRSHVDEHLPPKVRANLAALVRSVRVRQSLVRDAIQEAEEEQPVEFIGRMKMADGEAAVAAKIGQVLQLDRAQFRAAKDSETAFRLLRQAAESAGIFVVLIGNLGSWHTNLDPRAFRGFSVADPLAPFIVINETDTKAAWSFTLLHELAHLLLGRVGISGYDSDNKIEKFCDTVAAKFLVDDAELATFPTGLSSSEALARIGELAKQWNVSRKMLAYNLRRLGRISQDVYATINSTIFVRTPSVRQAEDDGGPNAHVIRKHRLGQMLVTLVSRYVDAGVLTASRAGAILGVAPTSVGPLIDSGRRAA